MRLLSESFTFKYTYSEGGSIIGKQIKVTDNNKYYYIDNKDNLCKYFTLGKIIKYYL